jgi:hypothetical protein
LSAITRGCALGATVIAGACAVAPGAPPNDAGPLPTGGPSTESRIDPLYSRIASLLGGRRIEVRCWSQTDWSRLSQESMDSSGSDLSQADGYVKLPSLANLSPNTCARLDLAHRRIWPRSRSAQADLAEAVNALAFDSQLLGRTSDTATAECYAVQLIRPAAVYLGVTRRHAATLASLFWTDLQRGAPLSSVSLSCGDGRKLDLHPATHAWP